MKISWHHKCLSEKYSFRQAFRQYSTVYSIRETYNGNGKVLPLYPTESNDTRTIAFSRGRFERKCCLFIFGWHKPAFGIYEVQEIELPKAYFRVVGRTYARSLLIDRQNQRYEGSCVGLSDTLCTIRDNRDFFANKLQFLRLNKEKEIGVVLYVEGLDLINKRQFVIDNRAKKEELIQRYRQRQLKLSIMVFSFLICPLVLGLLKFLAHRKGY